MNVAIVITRIGAAVPMILPSAVSPMVRRANVDIAAAIAPAPQALT
jgi:hypothetical protein